jgi:hypothetical protein
MLPSPHPLRQMTDVNPSTPDIPAKGNDAIYFRTMGP